MVHKKLRLLLTKHLLDPTSNTHVLYGLPMQLIFELLESVQNRAAWWIKSFWDSFAYKWSKKSSTIRMKNLPDGLHLRYISNMYLF